MNTKKFILPNLPYVLFIWIFDKVAQAFRLAGGADLSAKVLNLGNGFSAAFESMAPSFHPLDLRRKLYRGHSLPEGGRPGIEMQKPHARQGVVLEIPLHRKQFRHRIRDWCPGWYTLSIMKSADNTLFQTETAIKHRRESMDKNARVFALVFYQYKNISARYTKTATLT